MKGGLAIRCPHQMNEALKAEWLWRFANEDDTMWRKVIEMIYGVENFGWGSKKISCS